MKWTKEESSLYVKLLLTRTEGLRTEAVVHCTDHKAHWGDVIVILGNVNDIDMIQFESRFKTKGSSTNSYPGAVLQ